MSLKCYIYARIGPAPKVDEIQLEAQVQALQAYASQNDMTVLGIIRAYGEPGTQAWRGSTLMLKEAMAKEPADVILTVNHARLCRPTEGLIELADAFQKYGASILSLKEGKFKHSVCAALYLRVATYAQTLDEETPLDR